MLESCWDTSVCYMKFMQSCYDQNGFFFRFQWIGEVKNQKIMMERKFEPWKLHPHKIFHPCILSHKETNFPFLIIDVVLYLTSILSLYIASHFVDTWQNDVNCMQSFSFEITIAVKHDKAEKERVSVIHSYVFMDDSFQLIQNLVHKWKHSQ